MEQEAFSRFRRALPLEIFMLSMLLEEHKEMQRLRRQMDETTGRQPPPGEDPSPFQEQ